MGPLKGIRIVEFAGIGPAPMSGMLLADMGATVLRLERPSESSLGLARPARFKLLNRGRRSIVVDLKRPQGVSLVLSLIEKTDALIESFRPGTMERLGLGPKVCFARNPRLVFGRLSGWGQEGPLANSAGHDLNYIALSGALDAIGRKGQPPTPPLNLVGDFAGGALYLAVGILSALLEAQRCGRGQVVDAAVVDGATSLMTSTYGLHAAGMHAGPRGTNFGDSGAPWYDVYPCADGKYVAVAPMEAKFRAVLFSLMGIGKEWVERANAKEHWDELREIMQARFQTRTRDEWCELLEETDACFSPVLSMAEAPFHPHHRARGTFVEVGGVVQPAPAPRFSRTTNDLPAPPEETPGERADEAMKEWGFTADQIRQLRSEGALSQRREDPDVHQGYAR
ncbi:MAG: carnitine dehydratase [Betaproteobacteria bacterium RIFCSPLOWO2_12_FULL_62_13b]|nr:MAG: carnitine dehydratase [Betaproteobacteria bacterium RIFCSPLOWO2_12_FULL_62_13b]